jgi:hypothetical protein
MVASVADRVVDLGLGVGFGDDLEREQFICAANHRLRSLDHNNAIQYLHAARSGSAGRIGL